jgi:hypothetical protein
MVAGVIEGPEGNLRASFSPLTRILTCDPPISMTNTFMPISRDSPAQQPPIRESPTILAASGREPQCYFGIAHSYAAPGALHAATLAYQYRTPIQEASLVNGHLDAGPSHDIAVAGGAE